MRELNLLPQARLDLLEIWHFIASDRSARIATHVIDALERAMLLLRDMPV